MTGFLSRRLLIESWVIGSLSILSYQAYFNWNWISFADKQAKDEVYQSGPVILYFFACGPWWKSLDTPATKYSYWAQMQSRTFLIQLTIVK